MKKLLILLLLSTSLSTFADSVLTPLFQYSKFTEHQIISQIEINDLQIKLLMNVPFSSNGKSKCSSSNQVYKWVEINGQINPDVTYVVKKLFDKIENSPDRCKPLEQLKSPFENSEFHPLAVVISSFGGYLKDGYALGELFRKKGVVVHIPPDGICYSSCATAFLGGSFRAMYSSSELMFHAPYNYKNNSKKDIVCSSSDDKLLIYMQKMINKEDGQFLYDRTMSFCSNSDGWSINEDAAKLLNIANFPH